MKTLAYYPLHYGKEYLDISLQSILPHVDKVIILFSSRPSYGHETVDRNPDTPREMMEICLKYPKVQWVDITGIRGEGNHRDRILRYAQDYDLILAVDADEVWGEDLPQALKMAYEGTSRNYMIRGYVNFWRSFNHICKDHFTPVRIINLKHGVGEVIIEGTIYHFGTAQSEAVMRYKYPIHGHKDEIRPNWLEEKYFAGAINDLHPTSIGLWNAEPYDKKQLPDLIKGHVNYKKAVI